MFLDVVWRERMNMVNWVQQQQMLSAPSSIWFRARKSLFISMYLHTVTHTHCHLLYIRSTYYTEPFACLPACNMYVQIDRNCMWSARAAYTHTKHIAIQLSRAQSPVSINGCKRWRVSEREIVKSEQGKAQNRSFIHWNWRNWTATNCVVRYLCTIWYIMFIIYLSRSSHLILSFIHSASSFFFAYANICAYGRAHNLFYAA